MKTTVEKLRKTNYGRKAKEQKLQSKSCEKAKEQNLQKNKKRNKNYNQKAKEQKL